MTVYELLLIDGRPEEVLGGINLFPTPLEPYTLRLVVSSTSKVAHEGKLYTNYPRSGSQFDRNQYAEHSLDQANGLHKDHFVDIEVHQSGTFSVYFEYRALEGPYGQTSGKRTKSEPWNFVVPAAFKLQGKTITPNELCVQTVLSKPMGPLTDWSPKLKAIAHKGYNMIHFVPLQQRGESDSPFSIYDQLAWDEQIFPNGESDIKRLVSELEHEHGILALSDVVLNHTANNSAWLKDHTDAGYSAQTAPHLQAAILFENELLALSDRLAEQGQKISSSADIEAIVAEAKNIFDEVKFWEFYVLDVESLEKTIREIPFQGRPRNNIPNNLHDLSNLLVEEGGVNWQTFGDRFHRSLDTQILAELVAGSEFSVRELLNEANARLYAEFDEDKHFILDQTYGPTY